MTKVTRMMNMMRVMRMKRVWLRRNDKVVQVMIRMKMVSSENTGLTAGPGARRLRGFRKSGLQGFLLVERCRG